jgi:hypothetical protein
MSVSSRTNAAGETVWRYDFEFGGARHTLGGFKSEAKAEAAQKKKRKDLQRGLAPKSVLGPSAKTGKSKAGAVTLERAAAQYWTDIGEGHRSAGDIKRRIEICKRLIGADKDVTQIRTAMVLAAVKERMKEQTLTRYGKPSGKLVTGPGANRDVIDQLRPILNHAADAFEEEGILLPRINWKRCRQAEADPISCEFTDGEIEAWGAQLGDVERVFLDLALTYGPRQGELHFPPRAFKPDAEEGPELELGAYVGKGGVRRTSRKDRSMHAIPLLDEHVELLAPLAAQARAAGAETIWLEPNADGDLVSISYNAMRGRILRAALRAGIAKSRIIHGMRHHAGERIEREGGIGRVQQLLGHKQITTSRRYAHGSKSALRANLDGISRKKSRPSPAQGFSR